MSKDSATPYAAYEPPPSGRDLEAARGAFKSRDVEASRSAHMMSAHKKNAPEMHQTGGEQVKTIVFGGLDGILTAHAVIAAAVGAKLSPAHVLRHAHSRRHGSDRAGHPRLEAPSPSPSRQRQSRKPMACWRSRARAGLGNRAWSVTVMLGSRSPQCSPIESLSEAPPTSPISHNRSHRLLTTQVLALGISNVLADALSMVMSE